MVLWGLPFVLVPGVSLYSKLLPVNIQGKRYVYNYGGIFNWYNCCMPALLTGFGQGFRRSCFSVGAILGPLWAGGAVSFGKTYYVLLGVPAGLYMMMLVSVECTYH